MRYHHFYFLILTAITLQNAAFASDDPDTEEEVLEKSEKRISEYVVAIMEHYKQKDPIGLPIATIPDPMEIPPLSNSFSVGKIYMFNSTLNGLSKFRINHIKVDLSLMQVEAALDIEKMIVLGNYTLSTWLSKSQGPYTVILTGVYVKAIAQLEVSANGQLEAQEMSMDITFQNIAMNFERLGFFASMFQSIMNSLGSFIFDSIKPMILKETNGIMRNNVNEQVKDMPQRFPNSISPFDQMVSEARKKVRSMGYDPYKVDDYNQTKGVFSAHLTNTWLFGLSSFHRVGNVTFEVKNHTVTVELQVGTQKLEGSSQWEVSLGGMLSKSGLVTFTVDYFRVGVILSQDMDLSKIPVLDDIQLELGNIQIRCDGAGTLDYVVELAINVLPNLLRYQIMDALEKPVKIRIQETLNTINLENIIHENLPKLDEGQANGFQNFL